MVYNVKDEFHRPNLIKRQAKCFGRYTDFVYRRECYFRENRNRLVLCAKQERNALLVPEMLIQKSFISAIEDPISSTSSEVCLAKCSEDESDHFLTDSGGSDITSVNMGQSKSRVEQPQAAALESEEEFLNLNMENVSNERITENVEDIVHALENLLGDSYTIPDRGATTTPMKTSEDVTLALAELEELTKNEGGRWRWPLFFWKSKKRRQINRCYHLKAFLFVLKTKGIRCSFFVIRKKTRRIKKKVIC